LKSRPAVTHVVTGHPNLSPSSERRPVRSKKYSIVILEEDSVESDSIASLLEENNYEVTKYRNEAELRASEKFMQCDLLLINWSHKGMFCNNLLEYIRNDRRSKCAILVLTDRIREFDIVQALNSGADDVLQKPWGVFELIARMNAILRRTHKFIVGKHASINRSFQWPDLKALLADDQVVKLSTSQSKMIQILHAHLGESVAREYIVEHVWRRDYVDERTITVAVARVRKKLGIIAPEYRLLTVYGIGYRLEHADLM
jgi:DNA-binding response OmpR family regulator